MYKADKQTRVFLPTMKLLIRNVFEHDVGKNAAALAYYLLFALFPMLIFLSNLLGLLDLNVTEVTQALGQFLPKDIIGIIETYLDFVSNNSSHSLMWFALVFSVWFPMRAAKGLMDDVRLAYHLGKPAHPVSYTIRQLIYTFVLLIVVGLTLLFSALGKRALGYIIHWIPEGNPRISDYLLGIWQYLRFLPIGLLMFVALGTLYAASMDKLQPIRSIMPGIVFALLAWMLVSVGFSFYVEHFSVYSMIFGTLGAVIVLLMWLYMTAVILILGAELNSALQTVQNTLNSKDTD